MFKISCLKFWRQGNRKTWLDSPVSHVFSFRYSGLTRLDSPVRFGFLKKNMVSNFYMTVASPSVHLHVYWQLWFWENIGKINCQGHLEEASGFWSFHQFYNLIEGHHSYSITSKYRVIVCYCISILGEGCPPDQRELSLHQNWKRSLKKKRKNSFLISLQIS